MCRLTLKMGFLECCFHSGSCWNASSSMKVCADISTSVSSNCGRKTLIKKSSRNEVKVLITISVPCGTTSFNLFKKSSEGGSSVPILKTLGSTSSLCPVALPSRLVFWAAVISSGLFESETRPGTDDLRMNSRSSLSVVSSDDLVSISASLNILLFLSRGARENTLPPKV